MVPRKSEGSGGEQGNPAHALAFVESGDLRRTGISAIGDLPWGTHLCQFYQGKQELIDILVPYFRAGLESNEFCMWVTSEPLGSAHAKAVLASAARSGSDVTHMQNSLFLRPALK